MCSFVDLMAKTIQLCIYRTWNLFRETSLTVKDSTSSLQKRFNSMSEQVSEPMNMHIVELDT